MATKAVTPKKAAPTPKQPKPPQPGLSAQFVIDELVGQRNQALNEAAQARAQLAAHLRTCDERKVSDDAPPTV